jgi:hypothetical protein
LLYAKKGLFAELKAAGWDPLDSSNDSSNYARRKAAGPRTPGQLARRVYVRKNNESVEQLIVYDQAEQLLTPARRMLKNDQADLDKELNTEQTQVLFVIREEACTTLLEILESRHNKPIRNCAMFFLERLVATKAIEVTIEALQVGGQFGKSHKYASVAKVAAAIVEAVADSSERVLPMDITVYTAVASVYDFNSTLDYEKAKERLFHALVHSYGNPALATQILLILSAEPKWRRAVSLDFIKDVLPQYDTSDIDDMVRFYKDNNIVVERGNGELELTCDVLASLIHDRADVVLVGPTTRNILFLCQRLANPERHDWWKMNVLAHLERGERWRLLTNVMAIVSIATSVTRLVFGWAASRGWGIDLRFIATFLQCASGTWFIYRYNISLSRFLPRPPGLRGLRRGLSLTLLGFAGIVAQCLMPELWICIVGLCFMMIGVSSFLIYGDNRQDSPTESHNPRALAGYGFMILFVGFVLVNTRASDTLIILDVPLTGLCVALAVGRSSFNSFGHVGFAAMSTQALRIHSSKVQPESQGVEQPLGDA